MAELGDLFDVLRRHEEQQRQFRKLMADVRATSVLAGLDKLRDPFAILAKIETPMLDAIASFKASERFVEAINSVAASSLRFVDQIQHEQKQFASMVEALKFDAATFAKRIDFAPLIASDLLAPRIPFSLPPLPLMSESDSNRRIEELEQRVADLEALLNPSETPPAQTDTDDDPDLPTGQYL